MGIDGREGRVRAAHATASARTSRSSRNFTSGHSCRAGRWTNAGAERSVRRVMLPRGTHARTDGSPLGRCERAARAARARSRGGAGSGFGRLPERPRGRAALPVPADRSRGRPRSAGSSTAWQVREGSGMTPGVSRGSCRHRGCGCWGRPASSQVAPRVVVPRGCGRRLGTTPAGWGRAAVAPPPSPVCPQAVGAVDAVLSPGASPGQPDLRPQGYPQGVNARCDRRRSRR